MNRDPDPQAIARLANRAAAALERAGTESVVIIVTFSCDNGESTRHHKTGKGNYYAQRGSVIEWIDMTREQPQPAAPPPDPGDEWKNA